MPRKPDEQNGRTLLARAEHPGTVRPALLFGCGRYGSRLLELFESAGIPVAAFGDNSPERQGTVFKGRPVLKPQDLHDLASDKELYIAVYDEKALLGISRQLSRLGLAHDLAASLELRRLYDKLQAPGRLLEVGAFFKQRWTELRTVYDWFDDERSKLVYLNLIKTRFSPFDSWFHSPICRCLSEGDQYYAIPEFASRTGAGTFVDIGAYIGDSVEQFLSHNFRSDCQIYSFEPYPETFEMLRQNVERLAEGFQVPPNA